jgi:hypothetical protein
MGVNVIRVRVRAKRIYCQTKVVDRQSITIENIEMN